MRVAVYLLVFVGYFWFIAWLVRRASALPPATPAQPPRRTMDLTEWERAFIERRGLCPDCATGGLQWGPTGESPVNVRCGTCGSRFIVVLGESPSRAISSGRRLSA